MGVDLPGSGNGEFLENLQELDHLALTAGLEVVAHFTQERQKINPALFIGSGKTDELLGLVEDSNSNVVIFDDDLSPAQIRNLENKLKIKIIDRSTLILDIFAKHARTRESKTQVELAQLQYLLPRLTRQWTHLSRQVGGIGTKGPGETQLETDRRLIRARIEKLRKDLIQIERQRIVQRKNREDHFRAALVGYTNVGKSTLMNILSEANVLVEDQLFATLESTIRRVQLDENHEMLLGDTVGFIRKLPHHLIASFKTTLDEVRDANLLLHVVDVSHPRFREQMHIVLQVLEELNLHKKTILTVFNKTDRIAEMGLIQSLKNQYPDSVFISGKKHIGIEHFKNTLIQHIEKELVTDKLFIPFQEQKFLNFIHNNAVIKNQDNLESGVELEIICKADIYAIIKSKYAKLSETQP